MVDVISRRPSRPRVSMVVLVRNGREHLRACLESCWDHVDELVVVDVYSRDGSMELARRFAAERADAATRFVVDRFHWSDGFVDLAAARNHAHSLASCEWQCWMDQEERLVGGRFLRRAVEDAVEAVPDAVALLAPRPQYLGDTLQASTWKLRLFRRDAVRWRYRVGESPVLLGADAVQSAVGRLRWELRLSESGWRAMYDRVRRDAAAWLRHDPDDPWALIQAVYARGACGSREEALLRRVLRVRGADAHARQLAATWLGEMAARRGQYAQARSLALSALRAEHHAVAPRLLLAQLAAVEGDPEAAIREARAGLLHLDRYAGPLCVVLVEAACALGRPEEVREDVRRAMLTVDDPKMRALWRDLRIACGDRLGMITSISR